MEIINKQTLKLKEYQALVPGLYDNLNKLKEQIDDHVTSKTGL